LVFGLKIKAQVFQNIRLLVKKMAKMATMVVKITPLEKPPHAV
jgi:uncharacterized coiled-coil protein SlyX